MDARLQTYIDAIPAEHRPLFDRVQALIFDVQPEADVGISYGIPTYKVGKHRLHVGVWKHGVSLYGWQEGDDGGFTQRHPELRTGKGTIQLSTSAAEAVCDDELRDLVRAALGD